MEVKEAIDRAKIIADFYNRVAKDYQKKEELEGAKVYFNRANAIYTLIDIAKNKGEQNDSVNI